MDCDALLTETEGFSTLDEAFRWAVGRTPKIVPADVIAQDEYTHDVLFRASATCYLVFDTT